MTEGQRVLLRAELTELFHKTVGVEGSASGGIRGYSMVGGYPVYYYFPCLYELRLREERVVSPEGIDTLIEEIIDEFAEEERFSEKATERFSAEIQGASAHVNWESELYCDVTEEQIETAYVDEEPVLSQDEVIEAISKRLRLMSGEGLEELYNSICEMDATHPGRVKYDGDSLWVVVQ